MTDEQQELIHHSAHRLRNRLTFLMLCSDLLKLDLRGVLTPEHEQAFQRMDRILQETKTVLNTLLRQIELEPSAIEAPDGYGLQLIGGRVQPDNAA